MLKIILGIVFLVSLTLTGIIRHYTLAKNILDVPNDRSSHQIPTPRGGGLAIVILFTMATLGLAFKHMISHELFYALSGGLMIALIGWLDDVTSVRSLWRIMVHALAAVWAVYWLGAFSILGAHAISSIITVFTIIWCVNLYNFMDGIDGLAATEGVCICLFIAFVLASVGASSLSFLCLMLAASIAGFLVWNWPPAKIFMGDVGSGYLGFILAVLALSMSNTHLIPLSFWSVISAVFLCDATFTVIYRGFQGKRWYEAHREHAYQQIIKHGVSHRAVTVGVLLINCTILFPLAYMTIQHRQWTLGITSLGFLIFFGLWRWIIKNNFRILLSAT